MLGAITNTGVAWALAATMEPWYVPDSRGLWQGWLWKDGNIVMFASSVFQCGGGHTQLHECPEVSPKGYEQVASQFADKVVAGVLPQLPHWSAANGCDDIAPPSNEQLNIVDEARGWPCMSLRYRLIYRAPYNNWPASVITTQGGLRLAVRGAHPFSGFPLARAFPLVPTWPGFAINTLFYAAALWVVFAFPFVIRRLLRVKRGLCAVCGYSLRGTVGGGGNRCPECGAAILQNREISSGPCHGRTT
jgi:hypothetical protein